jgi:hypothetical protein
VTPDGRYFVVHGRLWRMANSGLDGANRTGIVGRLMAARPAVRKAKKASASRHHSNFEKPALWPTSVI